MVSLKSVICFIFTINSTPMLGKSYDQQYTNADYNVGYDDGHHRDDYWNRTLKIYDHLFGYPSQGYSDRRYDNHYQGDYDIISIHYRDIYSGDYENYGRRHSDNYGNDYDNYFGGSYCSSYNDYNNHHNINYSGYQNGHSNEYGHGSNGDYNNGYYSSNDSY